MIFTTLKKLKLLFTDVIYVRSHKNDSTVSYLLHSMSHWCHGCYTCKYILKETSNAKYELKLLGWTLLLCLRFVLYIRLVNSFVIAMYDVMNYSLSMPNLV